MLPTRSRGENAMMNVPLKQVQTSQFDLSHYHRTSFDMGALIPFFCKPTLPNDYWQLSAETLIRMPKLFFPIMDQVEIHTAFFYVANTTIFDEWKSAIKPDFGSATKAVVPYIKVDFDDAGNYNPASQINKLYQYMGFNTPLEPYGGATSTPTYELNALPIVAYWKIWNDFYRRPQTQPEFGMDDGQTVGEPYLSEQEILRDLNGVYDVTSKLETYYEDWCILMGKTYNTEGWQEPVHRNWNPDYYTMATFEPQYGENVLIPQFNLPSDLTNPRTYALDKDGNKITPGSTANVVAATGGRILVSGAADIAGFETDAGATIAQLRLAESMQQFLERLNRTGDRYKDFIRGFFGVDPSPFSDDYAVYIGSSTGVIAISDVFSTSDTRANAPTFSEGLGSYAGKAFGVLNSNSFQYQCRQHGHIIGIVNVQPRSSYYQGTDKLWEMRTWEDFAFDEFAHTGDEPIYAKEIVRRTDIWIGSNPDENAIFGFVPKYSWWKYSNDVVSGELRSAYDSFHLGRKFPENQEPILDGEFLQCYPQTQRVMEKVNGTHDCYAWIWCQAKVIRNLPKYSIPMI